MKNRKKFLFSVLAITATAWVCMGNDKKESAQITPPQLSASTAVKELSLEEKIGQMLMLDFRYWRKQDETSQSNFTVMNNEVASIIKKYHLGGVILFKENVPSTEQTIRLIDGLKKSSSKTPLLVSTDQEGGVITRVQTGTNLPGNMAIGATRDTNSAYNSGKVIGTELNSLGINHAIGPVLDVNSNSNNPVIGIRSFGSKAELVSEMGSSFLRGVQAQNVITSAKHFPGHGDTQQDSHTELPMISHSKNHLAQIELLPFKAAINNSVDMIMTAHIQVPALDNTVYTSRKDNQEIVVPATLSKKILTDLLRDELHFTGVTITDAMNMRAISDHFGKEEAIIMAINAGVDIVLMPAKVNSLEEEENISNVFQSIIQAVNDGRIKEEQIDSSVTRILDLKIKRGLFFKDQISLEERIQNAKKIINNNQYKKIESKMADKAITLLKNDDNTLPIKLKNEETVLVLANHQSQIDAIKETIETIKITENLADVKAIGIPFDKKNFDSTIKETIDFADYVLIGSDYANKALSSNSINFPLSALEYSKTKKKKTVLLSLRNPYDTAYFSEANAIIAVYGPGGYTNYRFTQPNISAGVRVIFGKSRPQGKLPVDIHSVSNPNQVIYPFGYGLDFK